MPDAGFQTTDAPTCSRILAIWHPATGIIANYSPEAAPAY